MRRQCTNYKAALFVHHFCPFIEQNVYIFLSPIAKHVFTDCTQEVLTDNFLDVQIAKYSDAKLGKDSNFILTVSFPLSFLKLLSCSRFDTVHLLWLKFGFKVYFISIYTLVNK